MRSRRLERNWISLLGATAGAALLGCGSYANVDRDFEDHPITDTGVAATIIMPGEGVAMPNRTPHGGLAPPAPGQPAQTATNPSLPPRGGANVPPGAGGAPAQSGSSSGHTAGAAPSGRGMTMIGGTTQDVERHQRINNEPAWAKVLKLPFLVAAYPFKKAHQAMTGPPDPTVKVTGPPPEAPPIPAELQAQRERALLEGMEAELARQGASPPSGPRQSYGAAPPSGPRQSYGAAPPSGPRQSYGAAPPSGPRQTSGAAPPSGPRQSYGAAPQGAPQSSSFGAAPRGATPPQAAPAPNGRRSIAEELAALRAAMAAPPPTPDAPQAVATASRPAPAPPAVERLYESVDRDADGRADRWIYRTGRHVTAEATDDDGDGRPERTARFVPGTREVASEEEDTDADGRPDTFTEYESGAVARRKADTDGDGEVDTWSFYADGALLRHEQDTDGDGFRDRMSFFEDGRLAREEEDRDGNGRPDRITWFDAQERIARQEEDTDRDGVMDLQSFYREGKLRRREMMD